jgi:hypothetical protein
MIQDPSLGNFSFRHLFVSVWNLNVLAAADGRCRDKKRFSTVKE